MQFIETPTFTKLVSGLMSDEDYALLQAALCKSPATGKVIPGSGGIRKLRWSGSGRGKRGGLRILYYWQAAEEEIWMLLAYPKNEKDDLTRDEVRQLKRLVESYFL